MRITELLEDLSVKEQLIFLGHLAQNIDDKRKELLGLRELSKRHGGNKK